MCKHCSKVCKLHLCLATESTNSACKHTIVTTALQQHYSQTELIFWITLVYETFNTTNESVEKINGGDNTSI